VNTDFSHICLTVAGRDGHPKEFGWLAGKKAAHKKGLVAGHFGCETPIARLEHKP
jgi:hypothetical protein